MGTLKTTIILQDKFSDQLKKINKSIQSTANAMAGLQKAQLSSAQLLRYEELKIAQAKQTTRQQVQKTLQSENAVKRVEEQRKLNAEKIAGKIELQNRALENQKVKVQNGLFPQLQAWASKLRNILTIYYAIRGAVQAVGAAVRLSDKMTMADARLNLVAGGDKKLKNELEAKSFAAAQRSTTDYLEFTKAVSKMGILAGDKFKNNDSIVRFVELMNKSFQISGADTSERNAAMLQITQAIASNRLQGDEFRSILENAPMVMDALNKSLGVGQDKLKEMAKEGEITADVLIKAMFDAGAKIEEMYKNLPMTWERHWAKLKNVGVLAFKPVQEQFKRLFNSKKFQLFINGLCTAMIVVGKLAGWAFGKLFDGFGKLVDWITKASGVLGFFRDFFIAVGIAVYAVIRVVLWLVKCWVILTGALLTIMAVWYLLSNGIKLATLWSSIWSFVTANAAWIIIAVIALVIYIVYKLSDSWADAMGKIAGAFTWLCALIVNTIVTLLSWIVDIGDEIVNFVIKIAERIYNALNGGFTGWMGTFQAAFGDLISWILGKIKPLVELWDKFKGTNYAATLTGWQDKASSWGKTTAYKKFDYYDTGGLIRDKYRFNLSDAYNYGYSKGSGWVNDLSSKFSDLTKVELGGQKLTVDALNGINNKLGDVGANTGNTAKNTGDIAKNTGSTEDYSYLRNWAYQAGLGNSIGYNIKIEQNNKNNIGSNMDLNRVVDAVRDAIIEGITVQAEGV